MIKKGHKMNENEQKKPKDETGKEESLMKRAEINLGELPKGGLVPTNFEGIWRLAQIYTKSGMMPKGVNTAEQAFVAINMGLEVGNADVQEALKTLFPTGIENIDRGIAIREIFRYLKGKL